MASNSDNITIGGGFDARATVGIATGINATPPAPEVIDPSRDLAWCARFYQTSYDNAIAPGASSHLGMAGASYGISGTSAFAAFVGFRHQMRAVPTVAYYDGAGNASKVSTLPSASTTWADNVALQEAPFNISTKGFLFTGVLATTSTSFIHYTADASLWGG